MFSSNKRKSISSKSAISQARDNNPSTKITTTTTTKTPPPLPKREPIEEDIKPPNATVTKTTTTTTVTTVTTTTVSSNPDIDGSDPDNFDRKNLNHDPLIPQNHIKNNPISSSLKPSTSFKDTLDKKSDLPSILKPSTSYNKIPTKSSSLPIKVNQSNNDGSSNSKSDSTTSSSSSTIKPSGYSQIEDKPRRNRSSTMFNGNLISESKSSGVRGSMIGESPTRLPRKHKRTGSAPILNVTSMSLPISLTNNLNKISSTKSMTNLNEFEAKIDRETPKQYLERMMYGVSRSKLVTILTQKADAFHQSALKAYMELFEFEKVPIDLALRKLLMECNLPKETQQIDRVMEAFAKSYHESNPDLFPSAG
ncbi:hypothetical protein C2G38_1376567, partial [Gigaspora rosea]